MAVVTQQDGETLESLEETLPAHKHLTNRGECLRVFALTFMDTPDDLKRVADGTYYHMAIETDRLGNLEHAFRAINSRMPIQVTNLNPRWSVFFADLKTGERRPLGISADGASWAAYDFGSHPREVFIGHPVLGDQREVSLTVTQAGPKSFEVEAHNPTDQPIRATIVASPDSGIAAETGSRIGCRRVQQC